MMMVIISMMGQWMLMVMVRAMDAYDDGEGHEHTKSEDEKGEEENEDEEKENDDLILSCL